MTGFELQIFGFGSERSTNCVTTNASNLGIRVCAVIGGGGQCDQKKNRQMSLKVAQNRFQKKKLRILTLFKKCLRKLEIWTN